MATKQSFPPDAAAEKELSTGHVGAPKGNTNNLVHGFNALKTLKRRIKDQRRWEWEAYSNYVRYLVSGLGSTPPPDKVMLCEEAAFIKLRVDMWKIGFFNENGKAAYKVYLAFVNSFSRLLERLKLQWGEDAPTLQDYIASYQADEESTEMEQ